MAAQRQVTAPDPEPAVRPAEYGMICFVPMTMSGVGYLAADLLGLNPDLWILFFFIGMALFLFLSVIRIRVTTRVQLYVSIAAPTPNFSTPRRAAHRVMSEDIAQAASPPLSEWAQLDCEIIASDAIISMCLDEATCSVR
jgi:hypothetical protein